MAGSRHAFGAECVVAERFVRHTSRGQPDRRVIACEHDASVGHHADRIGFLEIVRDALEQRASRQVVAEAVVVEPIRMNKRKSKQRARAERGAACRGISSLHRFPSPRFFRVYRGRNAVAAGIATFREPEPHRIAGRRITTLSPSDRRAYKRRRPRP
jgi:hypothetical protein